MTRFRLKLSQSEVGTLIAGVRYLQDKLRSGEADGSEIASVHSWHRDTDADLASIRFKLLQALPELARKVNS